MITITQNVPDLVLSKMPVILNCKTSLVADSTIAKPLFLRIYAEIVDETGNSRELVNTVDDKGLASFNISDALQSFVSYGKSFSYSRCKAPTHSPAIVTYSINLYEKYYSDGQTVSPKGITIENKKVFEGTLSDLERQTLSPDIKTHIPNEGKLLSRKPATDEVVCLGQMYYVPFIHLKNTDAEVETTASLIDSVDNGTLAIDSSSSEIDEIKLKIPISLRNQSLKMSCVETSRTLYAIPPNENVTSFIFVNSFGMLESVVALCNNNRVANLSSETFTLDKENSFSSFSNIISDSEEKYSEYGMSSGWVNEEWKEWWLHEFLTTRQAWMLINNKWIACGIIPDEKYTIYDRSKTQAYSISFTVRLSLNGPQLLSW